MAISEGRRLFQNIRRFIVHLLTTNVAEVLILILGLSFLDEAGMSVFPLSPIGVLWVNMASTQYFLHEPLVLIGGLLAYQFAACFWPGPRKSGC